MTLMQRSNIHLVFHLVNILLSVFNHLDSLLPLLLEVSLSLLNLLLLNLDPPIDLLLLLLERSW